MPPTPKKKRNAAPFVLRLDLAAWERARLRYDCPNDEAAAKALQIASSTISRLRTGKCGPSDRFIATVLGTWRGETFGDLFEIVKVAA